MVHGAWTNLVEWILNSFILSEVKWSCQRSYLLKLRGIQLSTLSHFYTEYAPASSSSLSLDLQCSVVERYVVAEGRREGTIPSSCSTEPCHTISCFVKVFRLRNTSAEYSGVYLQADHFLRIDWWPVTTCYLWRCLHNWIVASLDFK